MYFTDEARQKLQDYLATHELPVGLGTKESACSVAAINLAISGHLTDTIPLCMSEVIGNWVINVQDCMPSELRNSTEWKELLPFAAGTGRDHEQARAELLMTWLWEKVLPQYQTQAVTCALGSEWQNLLKCRTDHLADVIANTAGARKESADADNDTEGYFNYEAVEHAADRTARALRLLRAEAYNAASVEINEAVAEISNWSLSNPIGTLKALIAVSQ